MRVRETRAISLTVPLPLNVTPAKAGVQSQQHDVSLDSRFRGNDGKDGARE
jgi:hypothetical protein